MFSAKWILAAMVCVTAMAAQAETVNDDAADTNQFNTYNSELEATFQSAAQSLDETLNVLLVSMDDLKSQPDVVAQVQP
ncbi:MAG: hypothetical protein R3292_00215 [Alcanivorax sp.]|nr:hypothetical protein [Alcanivorax sp.]